MKNLKEIEIKPIEEFLEIYTKKRGNNIGIYLITQNTNKKQIEKQVKKIDKKEKITKIIIHRKKEII